MKKNVPLLLIVFVLLFLAAWLPRMSGLDQLVTVDEPKWLTRSANFYQAIANGHADDTYQSEHPGVTIMWAGTLGFLTRFPAYAAETPGQFSWETPQLERWLAEAGGPTPLDLAPVGSLVGRLCRLRRHCGRFFPTAYAIWFLASHPDHALCGLGSLLHRPLPTTSSGRTAGQLHLSLAAAPSLPGSTAAGDVDILCSPPSPWAWPG